MKIESLFKKMEERELKKREKKEKRKEKDLEAQKFEEEKQQARATGGNAAIQLQQNYFGNNDPVNITLKIELVNDTAQTGFRNQASISNVSQNQITLIKNDTQDAQS